MNILSCFGNHIFFKCNFYVITSIRLVLLCSLQDRLATQHKFFKRKRFDEIIIRSGTKSDSLVFYHPFRRRHNHRSRLGTSNFLEDIKSIHTRQHHIQYNQIIRVRQCFLETFYTVLIPVYLSSFGSEIGNYIATNLLIVFDHK